MKILIAVAILVGAALIYPLSQLPHPFNWLAPFAPGLVPFVAIALCCIVSDLFQKEKS